MIDVNASQPYRKLYLVELSLAGSSIKVSAVQFANAPKLIVSDAAVSSSKFTVLSAVQPENAFVEIISTDPGISTLCSPRTILERTESYFRISVRNRDAGNTFVFIKCIADRGYLIFLPLISAVVGKVILPPSPLYAEMLTTYGEE